jgi:hypothetical protein
MRTHPCALLETDRPGPAPDAWRHRAGGTLLLRRDAQRTAVAVRASCSISGRFATPRGKPTANASIHPVRQRYEQEAARLKRHPRAETHRRREGRSRGGTSGSAMRRGPSSAARGPAGRPNTSASQPTSVPHGRSAATFPRRLSLWKRLCARSRQVTEGGGSPSQTGPTPRTRGGG